MKKRYGKGLLMASYGRFGYCFTRGYRLRRVAVNLYPWMSREVTRWIDVCEYGPRLEVPLPATPWRCQSFSNGPTTERST